LETELLYKDITEKIIGASFDVHSFLGNGFQEVIYQRALAWEFTKRSLQFEREIEQDIYYRELTKPIGKNISRIKSSGRIARCASCASTKLFKSVQIGSRLINKFWQ
jgi:hypothetical protein